MDPPQPDALTIVVAADTLSLALGTPVPVGAAGTFPGASPRLRGPPEALLRRVHGHGLVEDVEGIDREVSHHLAGRRVRKTQVVVARGVQGIARGENKAAA